MTLFGYDIYWDKRSPKDQKDEDLWIFPSFGFKCRTFNNPVHRPINMALPRKERKRILKGHRYGLYIHVWLFSHRFTVDFTKMVPLES
jgi:hypothetical protein